MLFLLYKALYPYLTLTANDPAQPDHHISEAPFFFELAYKNVPMFLWKVPQKTQSQIQGFSTWQNSKCFTAINQMLLLVFCPQNPFIYVFDLSDIGSGPGPVSLCVYLFPDYPIILVVCTLGCTATFCQRS